MVLQLLNLIIFSSCSTYGCPFGEGCRFLHYFPGGYQAVSEMTNLGGATIAPPGGMMMDGPPTPIVKTRLCNKYNTAEGCKWGDRCHFAHGERELGKSMMDNYMPPQSNQDPLVILRLHLWPTLAWPL